MRGPEEQRVERALRAEYAGALGEFLRAPGESTLLRAGTLGRQAISEGIGVLEMAASHHVALAQALRDRPEAAGALVESAGAFFCEALSGFEMAYRGFREVSASIGRVIQFAAAVSHELRTPLTSLMSSAGMLGEILRAPAGSSEAKLLANIDTSVRILKSRTDDLLDLVGFQTGALSIRVGDVDLPTLLASVVDRLAPTATDVEIRLTASDSIPTVIGDARRLEQVVSNLLQNALKYGADGKRVDVRLTTRHDELGGEVASIEVQDYGAGISLWERLRIWQPNYRGATRYIDLPGLGIGLALCRELVQQHHGTISLESAEGRGSLFRVELPLRR